MKTTLLTLSFLLFSFCFFSTSFAQIAPGYDGTGDGIPPEGGGTTTSTFVYKTFSFKRNNGNGIGVCGANAQIRVVFDPMPATFDEIPNLTSIIYKGNDLIKTTNYVLILRKEIINQTQPYVSYCVQGIENLPGASDGNIPAGEKLTLKFNNQL